MNWEKIFFSRLIIAAPEIAWSDEFVDWAVRTGYFRQDEVDSVTAWRNSARHYGQFAQKLSGESLAQRMLLVVPELISVRSINLLRRLNLMDEKSGHILRLFVGSLTSTGIVPGSIPNNATIFARLQGLAGTFLSQESINLMRYIRIPNYLPGVGMLWGEISADEARFLRGVLLGAGRLNAARQVMGAGDGILDRLILVGAELMDPRFIRAAVLTGAISAENARILSAALRLGNTAWRTSTRTWNAAGFEQRALLAATGIFSQEMITFLRAVGIISSRTATTLSIATQLGRTLARLRLDSITQINRAIRVLPGEAPIATFARVSRVSESDILALLEKAARDTQKRIEALSSAEKIGARTRLAQERILLNSLYGEIHDLWEGVGYLTIMGEKDAARAAVDSMDFLTQRVYGRAGAEADLIRRQLREAGRAGVDSLISREENIRPLSRRIYKNLAWTQNQIARRIQINLIRGVSAKEFAADVASLFRPSVRGGVSYAAMRLARTEINNAFHLTSIRYTREMPWVTGYHWNLSATHAGRMPRGDVCNDYAHEDHEGIGAGNYSKRSVPSKPHPQCLCFITPMAMDPKQFATNYRRGTFNAYLNARQKAGMYAEVVDDDPLVGLGPVPSQAGKVAGSLVFSGGLQLAENWLLRSGPSAG